MASQLVNAYFRRDRLPHIWCPGCGNGIVVRAVVQAVSNLKLDKDRICLVAGIGCSSRAAGYLDFNTIHTTHGRALAFATGVKLANPELDVLVIAGDGDAAAIGGNHLIHAARRNINITTVIFNNSIYGMTGGQYSPETPRGEFGTTAPYGNIDEPFDIGKLVDAAGATYVARGTVYHAKQLARLIENGIRNKGFSLIEAISICPTYYGRKNRKGNAVDMLRYQRDNAVNVGIAGKMTPEQLQGKIITGVLKNTKRREYTEEYQKILNKFTEASL